MPMKMGDLRCPDEGYVVPARSEHRKSLRPLIPVIISTGGGGGITLPLLQEKHLEQDDGDDVDTTMMVCNSVPRSSSDPRVYNPMPLRWYYQTPRNNVNVNGFVPSIEEWPKVVQAIESRGGSRPVFLYRKKLEGSDVRGDLNRLFLTKREALMEFLNAAEAAAVDESARGLRIVGVDAGGKPYNLGLKKWPSLKMTVINSDWNKLVAANNAEKGDFVQIWGFRHNHGNLGLAIIFN